MPDLLSIYLDRELGQMPCECHVVKNFPTASRTTDIWSSDEIDASKRFVIFNQRRLKKHRLVPGPREQRL